MSPHSLADVIESYGGDPVAMLRDGQMKQFPAVADEYSHWIEEQRAWQETCSIADLSHHMTDLFVEGPDAQGLFADLGVNDFEAFTTGQAKQFVACNPEGYMIGDGILFKLGRDSFDLVGIGPANNWVQYHSETGEYDVVIDRDDDSLQRDGGPRLFRYQIQGPRAHTVMAAVTDGPLPDLDFFHFAEVTIDGRDVNLLRHGMAGEAGFEFWGDWDHAGPVKDAVLDAGEPHGIRHLGTESYQSAAILGWVAIPVPAVYGPALAAYRDWLTADSFEANASIGGSYVADDISEYYVTPAEVGYGRLVDFDHDFIGSAALREHIANQQRELVTLVWEDRDVIDAYASLFEEGPTAKFMDLPAPRWGAAQYDAVRDEDRHVGVSKVINYDYNERTVLSLGIVDTDYSDPGTELTLRWGLTDAPNRNVERHEERGIGVTVAPVPLAGDRR